MGGGGGGGGGGSAFAKLRKATISFVTSVILPFYMKTFGSHWTQFHEIWGFLKNLSKKIQVLVKYDKNNRHFTWGLVYIYDNIPAISS